MTFTKDISPIVFVHCSGCHRPGQSAPFSLLNYAEVKKHASDVATVTARRYMPPWLPESGPGEFIGDRRLSADQIGVIQQWVAEGSIEGLPQDLAPMPRWDGDWQLGTPDTVVTMPQPYSLVADGRDVYRNFVIPTTLSTRRFVRAVEFHPGNAKVVHHAFVKVDRTRESRRRDDLDAAPGFAGMSSIAEVPGGHFLGWQPGRLPVAVPEGLAWSLEPGDDLVVQMHLNPSGKPENVQASVGLYFTARPPTNSCFKILLTSYAMDIPAGASHYVVEDRYELPVDVEVLAVLPHAHYLAREMEGWATLPDGSRKRLLWIRQWDFNWQGDYRYSKPVFLPKGTALEMRFTYDNSTNNARNPQQPPQRVTYGLQSIDEMAELWFQVLAGNAGDLSRLTRDYETKSARLFEEHDNYLLRKDPEDAEAHDNLALRLLGQNKLREAEEHLRRALRSRPDFGQAHYDLGLVMRHLNRLPEARAEFETALRLNPQDFRAHGNLGFIALAEGDLFAARQQFENALHLNPDDAMARAGLSDITNAIGRTPK
ncbi:MAG: hypothetical protein QOF48_3558 [Verrucomicrobiota bacterium]